MNLLHETPGPSQGSSTIAGPSLKGRCQWQGRAGSDVVVVEVLSYMVGAQQER